MINYEKRATYTVFGGIREWYFSLRVKTKNTMIGKLHYRRVPTMCTVEQLWTLLVPTFVLGFLLKLASVAFVYADAARHM